MNDKFEFNEAVANNTGLNGENEIQVICAF